MVDTSSSVGKRCVTRRVTNERQPFLRCGHYLQVTLAELTQEILDLQKKNKTPDAAYEDIRDLPSFTRKKWIKLMHYDWVYLTERKWAKGERRRYAVRAAIKNKIKVWLK